MLPLKNRTSYSWQPFGVPFGLNLYSDRNRLYPLDKLEERPSRATLSFTKKYSKNGMSLFRYHNYYTVPIIDFEGLYFRTLAVDYQAVCTDAVFVDKLIGYNTGTLARQFLVDF